MPFQRAIPGRGFLLLIAMRRETALRGLIDAGKMSKPRRGTTQRQGYFYWVCSSFMDSRVCSCGQRQWRWARQLQALCCNCNEASAIGHLSCPGRYFLQAISHGFHVE